MIVSDSSTLILLAKISLLETFLEKNKLLIPAGVYEESVIRGKERGDIDAYLIEKLVDKKRIIIKRVNEKTKSRVKKLFRITKGENETICLAKKGDLILTDDRKCINVCKTLKLKFTISADVVVTLYKKGRISKDKKDSAFDKLEEISRLKKELIDKRREECEKKVRGILK